MPRTEEHGTIITVHHPLVTVDGLPGARLGEMVEFEQGGLGQIFSLSEHLVDILVFSSKPRVPGEAVYRTDQQLEVSLSPALVGATVDALGEPYASDTDLAPGGDVEFTTQPVDRAPRSLTDRARIRETLHTGVAAIDLILPLGKGQRQLIVGDRKTGKTTAIMQLIQSQIHDHSLVVYAAIGKKRSEIRHLQQLFSQTDIGKTVTLVASAADDPTPVIYQTPFTAMAIAEYFTTLGLDVVVVLDDLTTHAKFYREIALVGKRFPGRDSYPGDIFYTHARLLERAGCFTHPDEKKGSVSITCLPLAETTESDLTDFIVSNLISITDGHLLFDSTLFARGRRPAIHTGLSVTRVGKQTQTALQREMSHSLTAFIALYTKTEGLTHFGAELTDDTHAILRRGEVLFAFLNQPREQILPNAVMLIMSGGILLDWFTDISAKDIQALRNCLLENYSQHPQRKKLLEALVSESEHLPDFLDALKQNQKEIIAACQP